MRKQYSIGTTAIIIALFVGIASDIHKNYDGPSPVSVLHWIGGK